MNRFGQMDQYIEAVKIDSGSYDVQYGLRVFPVSIADVPELIALLEGIRDKECNMNDRRVEELREEIRRLERELEIAKLQKKVRELQEEIAREGAITTRPRTPPPLDSEYWWPGEGWRYTEPPN